MKRGLLVLVLAAVVAGGAFALPKFGMSIGAGGLVGGDFGGGYEYSVKDNKYIFESWSDGHWKNPYFGGGGTIEDFTMGYGMGKIDFSITTLNIGLLLKYPFEIREKLSLFPLLGFDYAIALSVKMNGYKLNDYPDEFDDKSGDYSAFWFKLGGGLDFSFTDKLFLRGEVLYGIRLINDSESRNVSKLKNDDDYRNVKALLGHGLTAKIALGFKLF